MTPFANAAVAEVFENYPLLMRPKLLALREFIFKVAASLEGIGELEETLKWGEPAYLTPQSRSGSTVRIGPVTSNPSQYAMYFHCRTDLIATFKTMFPAEFKYQGQRAIVFDESEVVPTDALGFCVAAALTYHRQKANALG